MKYNKALWIACALTAVALLFLGCANGAAEDTTMVSVTNIALSETEEKNLAVGQTFELTAAITPGNASDKRIIWRSLHSNVAMILGDGLTVTIMALTPGETLIMAVSEDSGLIAACPIVVSRP